MTIFYRILKGMLELIGLDDRQFVHNKNKEIWALKDSILFEHLCMYWCGLLFKENRLWARYARSKLFHGDQLISVNCTPLWALSI